MTPHDLLLYILDGERSVKTTIEIANDFVSELLDENSNSTWGKALACEIEQFAYNNGVCPTCGDKLVYKKDKGDETEYFGHPVTEDYGICVCLECGYKED